MEENKPKLIPLIIKLTFLILQLLGWIALLILIVWLAIQFF